MKVKRSTTCRRLKVLQNKGYNMAGVERALELPQGSFHKIIDCEVTPSPEEVALVKFIYYFPVLIYVYDRVRTQRRSTK